jgi:thiol-disulfide isomerase/thioredoxin
VTQPSPGPAPEIHAEPPRSTAPAATTPAPTASAPTPPPAPPRFAQIELAPTQGELGPLLVDEIRRAKERGLVPVVEFYADWCPPCQLLHRNMKSPEIVEGFEGAYLVKLNLDDWHDKLKGTGFAPRTIPSFYLLTADGKPSGKMLDGDKWAAGVPKPNAPRSELEAWRAGAVARMGASLKAFLKAP